MKIYAFRVYGVASKNIPTKASLYEFTAGCGHFELVGNLFLGFFFFPKQEINGSLSYGSYKSFKNTNSECPDTSRSPEIGRK